MWLVPLTSNSCCCFLRFDIWHFDTDKLTSAKLALAMHPVRAIVSFHNDDIFELLAVKEILVWLRGHLLMLITIHTKNNSNVKPLWSPIFLISNCYFDFLLLSYCNRLELHLMHYLIAQLGYCSYPPASVVYHRKSMIKCKLGSWRVMHNSILTF